MSVPTLPSVLSTLFQSSDGFVAYTGAGISIASPSCAPNWWSLTQEILKAFFSKCDPVCFLLLLLLFSFLFLFFFLFFFSSFFLFSFFSFSFLFFSSLFLVSLSFPNLIYFSMNLFIWDSDGILTIADDLLRNDGKKFLEMMEKFAKQPSPNEVSTHSKFLKIPI